MIVVIDDERTHPNANLIIRNSEEAVNFLTHWHAIHQTLDELWLDHDLGINDFTGQKDTIRPVVKFLEEKVFFDDPVKIDKIVVHTANPIGRDWIIGSNLLQKTYQITTGSLSI